MSSTSIHQCWHLNPHVKFMTEPYSRPDATLCSLWGMCCPISALFIPRRLPTIQTLPVPAYTVYVLIETRTPLIWWHWPHFTPPWWIPCVCVFVESSYCYHHFIKASWDNTVKCCQHITSRAQTQCVLDRALPKMITKKKKDLSAWHNVDKVKHTGNLIKHIKLVVNWFLFWSLVLYFSILATNKKILVMCFLFSFL